MIGTRVAFRGAFGPHEGVVLEETGDSVILKVEKKIVALVAAHDSAGRD